MRVLSLLCLFVVSVSAHSSPANEEDSLQAMSYNIRYQNQRDGEDIWDHRKTAVFATIQKADVVGLQEVVSTQFQDIRAVCDKMDWYGVGRDDGAEKGEAVPIGWRRSQFELIDKGTFWLSPTPEKVGSRGWDAALPRVASWVRLKRKSDSREFLFVNTHFDHRGSEARTESARLLRTWLENRDEKIPSILSGDFNAQVGTPPINALLDLQTQSVRLLNTREASPIPDPGPNSTWNGFRKIESERRIDFLFVTEAVEVVEFKTLDPKTTTGRFASDHLPVTAKLRLK